MDTQHLTPDLRVREGQRLGAFALNPTVQGFAAPNTSERRKNPCHE